MGVFSSDKNVDRDARALMDRFQILGRKRNILAGNLSGGEQQILEMAMALILRRDS
jgi:branched-chain amino acid transport system ATP-binding protein